MEQYSVIEQTLIIIALPAIIAFAIAFIMYEVYHSRDNEIAALRRKLLVALLELRRLRKLNK